MRYRIFIRKGHAGFHIGPESGKYYWTVYDATEADIICRTLNKGAGDENENAAITSGAQDAHEVEAENLP